MSDVERTMGLLNTDDPEVWAEEFCRIFSSHTIMPAGVESSSAVDEDTMAKWFASAMQTAVDMYERRKLRTKQVSQATEQRT